MGVGPGRAGCVEIFGRQQGVREDVGCKGRKSRLRFLLGFQAGMSSRQVGSGLKWSSITLGESGYF